MRVAFIVCRFMLVACLTAVSGFVAPVLAGDLSAAMPQVQGTRRIVLEQLEQLLMADPQLQIIGQGSWLRPVGSAAQAAGKGPISRAYADPLLGGTSDHDLRLVMKGKDQAIASRWKVAQDKLRSGIQSLFPKNAGAQAIEETLIKYGFQPAEAKALAKQGGQALVGKILQSVNLYAPPQLMRNVVDEKTATALFKKVGSVPNLGGRIVEGVWGEGTTAAIQEFEAGGRLFWNAGKGGGKVVLRAGFVDLVHLAEGPGRYTLEGAANLSAQWAEKALEALHENDPALLAKYLKRLKSTLGLAAKKGNLSATALADTFGQLDALIAQAGQGGVRAGEVQRVVRGARMQASLLGELARNPGNTDRQILMAILDSKAPSRWGKVGEWFRNTWETADNWVMFERTLQGVFVAYSTFQVAGTWGAQGMETALRQAGVEATMLASLGPGAVALLANHMIDTAKEAGYDMSVRSQDWDNFLAGISSVQGCEGTTRKELSIHQLAVELASANEVRQAVESQATHIIMLCDFGTPEIKQGKWQALVNRMRPIVTAEWLRERKRILTQYIDLALGLDELMNGTVLRAVAEPQPVEIEAGAPTSVTVRLESNTQMAELREQLRRMEDTIRPLGGKKHYVYFSYQGEVTWNQNGQKQTLRSSGNLDELFEGKTFSLPGRGSWPLDAEFRLKVTVSVGGVDGAIDVFDAKPLLEREYVRPVPVRVDVLSVARAQVTPVAKAKLSLGTDIMAGEPVKLSWSRAQMPDFKPGQYKVVLWPRGTRLTQQDFYLLSYDPSGTSGGVFKYPAVVLSETANGDRIDIEVQVPQVYTIQKPEELELAFIFMDKEASLSSQLDKAMADLDKAQAEMDRKMAAMSDAEREALMRKMAEAMAQAEKQPPPVIADPSKEEVPAGTVRTVPVTLRPTELAFETPRGWQLSADNRANRRVATLEEGDSSAGNHVYTKASFDVWLDYTDEALNWMGEGQFNDSKRYGGEKQIGPLQIGVYKGEIVRGAAQSDGDNRVGHNARRGEAFLKNGRVQAHVVFGVETWGYAQYAADPQGHAYPVYDTRPAAVARLNTVYDDLDRMLASLRLGQQRAASAAPAPAPPATAAEAREDTYIRLVAAKTQAEPGEYIEIKAVLENPKGDEGVLRYEWGGNYAGSGDTVTFFASDPGDYSVTVIVRGARGVVGSSSVDLSVR